MSVDLLLVRHGQSEANAGLSLDPDCSLSDTGLEQARQLRLRLADHDLSGFIALTSPYRRTRQTAEQIAKVTGMAFAVDEGVREWAGPATVDGKHYPAESGGQLVERLADFLRRHDGRKVLVVSHAAPIAGLIRLAEGRTPDTSVPFWDGIDNCCLIRVGTGEQRKASSSVGGTP